MARVPGYGDDNPVAIEPLPDSAVEQRFTIILRQNAAGQTQLQFIPAARGVQIGPRNCVALCEAGITWCLEQEIALKTQENGKQERKVDLWVPPHIEKVVRPV